jgi:hypothetical protein
MINITGRYFGREHALESLRSTGTGAVRALKLLSKSPCVTMATLGNLSSWLGPRTGTAEG